MRLQLVEIRESKMRTIKISAEGQERLDRLLPIPACLGCERPFVEGERVKCGQCATCYQAVANAEARRKVKRTDLIREGKMLPNRKPGRQPKNDFTKELSERT